MPGVSDRLVTITGTLEQQLRAIFLIVSKLAEDPNYAQCANAPFSYTGTISLCMMYTFNQMRIHVCNTITVRMLKHGIPTLITEFPG